MQRKGYATFGAFWGFWRACPFLIPSSFLPPGDSDSCASLPSGIPTVPGKVTLQKDAQNLIGISIGGGAQYCPCLYIVQVLGAVEVGVRSWKGRTPSLLGHDKGPCLYSAELAPSPS